MARHDIDGWDWANPASGQPVRDLYSDLAPLAAAICNESLAALGARPVVFHAVLETVIIPRRSAAATCFAFRTLLAKTLHRHPAHECPRVGVHLWRPRALYATAYLLIADGRRCPWDTENADVSAIRSALASEGIRLEGEPCSGTVWRIILPDLSELDGERA